MKYLKCIYPDMFLTFGEIYKCSSEYEMYYYVKDNSGIIHEYFKWRFIDITRNIKMNKLLQ